MAIKGSGNRLKPCRICGIPTLLNWKIRVCSRKCMIAVRIKKKICPQCRCEFFSGEWKTKFCSHKCSVDAIRAPRPPISCRECKRLFTAQWSTRTRDRVFCSKECQSAGMRGKSHPLYRGKRRANRGSNWRERSGWARIRDIHCQCLLHRPEYIPSRKEELSVDHIVPYRMIMSWNEDTSRTEVYDPNALENLVSLCRACHQKKTSHIESLLLKGDVIGFIREMRNFLEISRTETALRFYGLIR